MQHSKIQKKRWRGDSLIRHVVVKYREHNMKYRVWSKITTMPNIFRCIMSHHIIITHTAPLLPCNFMLIFFQTCGLGWKKYVPPSMFYIDHFILFVCILVALEPILLHVCNLVLWPNPSNMKYHLCGHLAWFLRLKNAIHGWTHAPNQTSWLRN